MSARAGLPSFAGTCSLRVQSLWDPSCSSRSCCLRICLQALTIVDHHCDVADWLNYRFRCPPQTHPCSYPTLCGLGCFPDWFRWCARWRSAASMRRTQTFRRRGSIFVLFQRSCRHLFPKLCQRRSSSSFQ